MAVNEGRSIARAMINFGKAYAQSLLQRNQWGKRSNYLSESSSTLDTLCMRGSGEARVSIRCSNMRYVPNCYVPTHYHYRAFVILFDQHLFLNTGILLTKYNVCRIMIGQTPIYGDIHVRCADESLTKGLAGSHTLMFVFAWFSNIKSLFKHDLI